MSRNPSKEFSESSGHGRGPYNPRASVGCLIVIVDQASDAAALREEMAEACRDEDLEYGIRIASLGNSGGGRDPWSYFRGFRGGGRGGTMPLAMYKVYLDGREELVRGAEIAQIGLKAFKRVLAAGDTPHVLNSGRGGGRTVAVPALLFEELDLAKIDRDFDKPPILQTPLARASGN
jgi:hypothetical protein